MNWPEIGLPEGEETKIWQDLAESLGERSRFLMRGRFLSAGGHSRRVPARDCCSQGGAVNEDLARCTGTGTADIGIPALDAQIAQGSMPGF